MCACAGSSTERTRSFASCVPPELSGQQEKGFSSISPARSAWISSPAGLGSWARRDGKTVGSVQVARSARITRRRKVSFRSRSLPVHRPTVERPRQIFGYAFTSAAKICRRGPRHGWPQSLCNWSTASDSSFGRVIAAARRPQGQAAVRQPPHQPLSRHPFRTIPPHPASLVSI
jgi:hypothetical protein